MAEVKVILDPIGNVMNIWWGKPEDASYSEEVDDPTRNDIIVKDKQGSPISLEVIGLFPKELNISELVKKLTGRDIKTPFLLHS